MPAYRTPCTGDRYITLRQRGSARCTAPPSTSGSPAGTHCWTRRSGPFSLARSCGSAGWRKAADVQTVTSILSTLVILMLISCVGCHHNPTTGTDTPAPLAECEPKAAGTAMRLQILTWNVWMMPWWTFQSPRNTPRAAAIAAELLQRDFDILCLEKVFDSGARKVLARALASHYPYQYGPANASCALKVHSGVWVVSRFPLTNYQAIQFRYCAGIECFSRKGAMLLT